MVKLMAKLMADATPSKFDEKNKQLPNWNLWTEMFKTNNLNYAWVYLSSEQNLAQICANIVVFLSHSLENAANFRVRWNSGILPPAGQRENPTLAIWRKTN